MEHVAVTQAEVDIAKESIRKLNEGGCGFQEVVHQLINRHGITYGTAAATVEFAELIAEEKLVRP